jgi:hypothetical protein
MATLAGLFHKAAPAAPGIEDRISRFQATGCYGEIQLTPLGAFQCLIIALAHMPLAITVAAFPSECLAHACAICVFSLQACYVRYRPERL